MPKLPDRRFWWTNAAVLALVQAVLSIVLGLAALPSEIPTVVVVALVAASLVATLFIWWTAARQEADRVSAEARFHELLERLPALPAGAGRALENLGGLTNEQFRARVQDIVGRMRAMQQAFAAGRRDAFAAVNGAGGGAAGEAAQRQMLALFHEQNDRWLHDLRPEVLAIWDELRRRRHGAPPYPYDPDASGLIERGVLVGPSPLIDAAEAIERSARRLA